MTYMTNAFQHGISNSAVASNWYSRPADERFLDLDTMLHAKVSSAESMTSQIIDTHNLEIIGDVDEDNPSRGDVRLAYDGVDLSPTNWSFGQLSSLAGAPAGYLRDLPAPIAADALSWGLRYNRSRELVKAYHSADTAVAMTGPDYGRIYDHEIIRPIRDLVRETGGRWKVPGMMTGARDGMAVYDPDVPVTLDTTTLFASDRDVFIFLVDDRNPIEVGKLENGEPDLMFRGFYAWNSEVGAKTAGIAAFYLRGVCMNRNLWGVENLQEVTIRHTKFAPDRFAEEVRPALQSFAHNSTATFLEGVEAAKAAVVARDDDARLEFLNRRAGLPKALSKAAMARHVEEEGRPADTVWDMAQAITAVARDVPHQDRRLDVERKAGALLDKVAA